MEFCKTFDKLENKFLLHNKMTKFRIFRDSIFFVLKKLSFFVVKISAEKLKMEQSKKIQSFIFVLDS